MPRPSTNGGNRLSINGFFRFGLTTQSDACSPWTVLPDDVAATAGHEVIEAGWFKAAMDGAEMLVTTTYERVE